MLQMYEVITLDLFEWSNRRLTAQFISTKANELSDALSRNQMKRFRLLGRQMNITSDEIPQERWPVQKT